MASGDKPTPGNILEYCLKGGIPVDVMTSSPWYLINDVCEIVCYLWTHSVNVKRVCHEVRFETTFGSVGEGTATGFADRSTGNWSEPLEDQDTMFICSFQGMHLFQLDSSECHPGYIRLKPKYAEIEKQGGNDKLIHELTNLPLFLKMIGTTFATISMDTWENDAELESLPYKKGVRLRHQGGPGGQVLVNLKNKKIANIAEDRLLAVKGPTSWPVEAEEWRTRHRVSGWPSPALVEEATSQGYLLVPIPHPSSDCKLFRIVNSSKDNAAEMRFSFSTVERTLFRSLSRWQRDCFILVKLMCKRAMAGRKLLSTYHMKTLFLWMCEQYPSPLWTSQNHGQMACLFLEKIILALAKANIPNYFIPSNNLIDRLPREHLQTCLNIVRNVRRYILSHVVDLVRAFVDLLPGEYEDLCQILNPDFAILSHSTVLQELCDIVARGQQCQVRSDWLYSDSLTYRPLAEILFKQYSLKPRTNEYLEQLAEEYVRLDPSCELFDIEICKSGFQSHIFPDTASLYCSIASYYRVKYLVLEEREGIADCVQFFFEVSLSANETPYIYILAEYAAFLLDAGKYDEAADMLGRPYKDTGQVELYKHYVEGLGYHLVESLYFCLWLKVRLAALQGEPVRNIIVEYKELLKAQVSRNDPENCLASDAEPGGLEVYHSFCHGFKKKSKEMEEREKKEDACKKEPPAHSEVEGAVRSITFSTLSKMIHWETQGSDEDALTDTHRYCTFRGTLTSRQELLRLMEETDLSVKEGLQGLQAPPS